MKLHSSVCEYDAFLLPLLLTPNKVKYCVDGIVAENVSVFDNN